MNKVIEVTENSTRADEQSPSGINVPFFRVELQEDEIEAVVDVLRSGWLTTGKVVKQFEEAFGNSVNAKHSLALNSCTAALHLGVAALDLKPEQAVLVPTHTFASTAEIVRYMGAIPILVDIDPVTLNLDLNDAERKIRDLRAGKLPGSISPTVELAGIIPVHVGGNMLDMSEVRQFARKFGLWVIEDAAHALPAAFRRSETDAWRRCGEDTADVTCFSFYANKSITTGEGGMAVTASHELADRMKVLSLHGLSRDAWQRYSGGEWDYRIIAPGFKYNLTDVAGALGLRQLQRAEELRLERERIVKFYLASLAKVPEVQLPVDPRDRIHTWHLFPIRLHLEKLAIDRDEFVKRLRHRGVGFSVHWRPLHMHPYYAETYQWQPEHLPVASREWPRLVSLPLFPAMRESEMEHVVQVVADLCREHAR